MKQNEFTQQQGQLFSLLYQVLKITLKCITNILDSTDSLPTN